MIDIEKSNKEDEELLLPDVGTKKFNKLYQFNSETVIMKGVVKQLEKWPSYLFFVSFIGCIITVNLVLLVIATATFSLPTNITNTDNRDETNRRSNNVYSVKLEDRIWSMTDLCHIESAARENPELNINLINVYKEKPKEDIEQEDVSVTKIFEPEIGSVKNTIDLQNKATRSLRILREALIRDQLARKYENVKSQDIVVDNFFQGTNLSKVAGNLNDQTLRLATEAYFIWNSSGIAMRPKLYCNLKHVSQVMCEKENEKCVLDGLATVDPQNDIQAAGVPCQAFIGYLINEISKNDSIRKEDALLKSINTFCPRTHSCKEIRILKDVKTCTLDVSNTDGSKCPIVYHHGFLLNALNNNYLLPSS